MKLHDKLASYVWYQRLISCLLFQNVRFLYLLPFFTTRAPHCPVCGGSGVFEFKNRYTPLDRCESCGHVYTRRIPGQRILEQMYKDFGYWIRDKEHQGITDVGEGDHWNEFLVARMGIMERTGVVDHAKHQKIFELGCSEGILLKALEDKGHQAVGSEMNRPVAEAGMEKLSVDIRIRPFEELTVSESDYDAFVSFHTVEHLCDLKATFEKVVRMLKPEGAMLLEVPCGPGEYDNRDHVQFFCDESLSRLIKHYFEEVEIIPNEYAKDSGPVIGSIYGVGRFPRKGEVESRRGGR